MSSDLSGKTMGRYQIQEQLAQRSMTEVYQAYQPDLKRQVAIKVYQASLMQDQSVADMVSRAVRGSIALQHRNVERVYEFNTHENQAFKAMEYIQGPTLKLLIQELRTQRKLLPLPVIGFIINQVANGLAFVHEQEQHPAHRDVTSSNIMLRMKEDTPDDILQFVMNLSQNDVVLTDYGVSRVVHDAIQKQAPDRVPGLADYMSPELCQGKKGDGRADIYSLGVVLYELLTGTVPFPDGTPSVVMQKHINETIPAPSQLHPGLPKEVDEVVMKALAKNLNERFQDAEAFGLSVKQRMGQMNASLQLVDMDSSVSSAAPAAASAAAPAASATASAAAPAASARPKLTDPPSAAKKGKPEKAEKAAKPDKAKKAGKAAARNPRPASKSAGGGIVPIILVVLFMVIAIAAIVWFLMLA